MTDSEMKNILQAVNEALSASRLIEPAILAPEGKQIQERMVSTLEQFAERIERHEAIRTDAAAAKDPEKRDELLLQLAFQEQSINETYFSETAIELFESLDVDLATGEFQITGHSSKTSGWVQVGDDRFPEIVPLGIDDIGPMAKILSDLRDKTGINIEARRVVFEPNPFKLPDAGPFARALPDLIALECRLLEHGHVGARSAYSGENLAYKAHVNISDDHVQTVLQSEMSLVFFERKSDQIKILSSGPDVAAAIGRYRLDADRVIYDSETEEGLHLRDNALRKLRDVVLCLEEDIHLDRADLDIEIPDPSC